MSVPQHTEIGRKVFERTALIAASPFLTDIFHYNDNNDDYEMVHGWVKNRLEGDEYALHRACSSFHPLDEVIFRIVRRQGLQAFKKPDSVSITPVQYLEHNPFANVDQQRLMKRYILDVMGEIVS